MGVIALLFALMVGVGVRHLVRDDWSEARWAGVAAVATAAQTVGVIAALVYAKRQVEASRRPRQDQLLDRLEVLVYEDLLPAVSTLLLAWDSLVHTLQRAPHRLWQTGEGEALLWRWHEESNERVTASDAAITVALSRIRRTLRLLGTPHPVPVLTMRFAVAGLLIDGVPKLGEPVDPSREKPDQVAAVQKLSDEMRIWMDGYVDMHVATR
jgi:hypothetical protein